MLHDSARQRINIRPRVGHFACLLQNWWNGMITCVRKFQQWIVWKLPHGKFPFDHVSRISLSQHPVSKARNDLTSGQRVFRKLCEQFHCRFLATKSTLCVLEPSQAFLVGKTMQRTSKTTDTCSVSEIRITESTSNQVRRVC